MPRYAIDGDASRVLVIARSSIHDTRLVIGGVRGTVDADPATLADAGARVELEVDMQSADAGDWLKNRTLRKHLELSKHPTARFVLGGLDQVESEGDGFRARVQGTLSWRGRELALVTNAQGTVTESGIDAEASFELDVGDFGVVPPKVLMVKVESVVAVEIRLRASAS